MPGCAIAHVFTHLLELGGVPSMLRRHLRTRGDGMGHRAVIHFERGPFGEAARPEQVTGLGLRWFNTGRTLRRRWRAAFPRGLGGLVVYHNAWGLAATADLDGAERRFALLHSHWTGTEEIVSSTAGLCDGWICVSEPLKQLVQARLPELPQDRIAVLPVPAGTPPSPTPRHRPLINRPLVLGFSGRVIREQKRVDRLPELDRRSTAAGLDCRWEILGDGPDLPMLRTEMPAERSHLRGRVSGAAYWEALGNCDVLVFTSDYEGLPISLVEAFSCGVLTLFPRIGCGADDYVTRIAPELLYQPGDLADAVRGLRWLRDRSPGEIETLRERARNIAAPHVGGAYDDGFANFTARIAAGPRVSAGGPDARRAHPGEWVPYAVVGRLRPENLLRRGYV